MDNLMESGIPFTEERRSQLYMQEIRTDEISLEMQRKSQQTWRTVMHGYRLEESVGKMMRSDMVEDEVQIVNRDPLMEDEKLIDVNPKDHQ